MLWYNGELLVIILILLILLVKLFHLLYYVLLLCYRISVNKVLCVMKSVIRRRT